MGELKFGVSVRELGERIRGDDRMYYVEFGGSKRCIDITVIENSPRAYLTSVKHDKKCVMDGALKRGKDRTVEMMLCAFFFVAERFPFVEFFQLRDKSHFRCQFGLELDLWSLYLAKHGKTWYMDKFSAVPDNEPHRQFIYFINVYLDDLRVKAGTSFDDVYSNTIEPSLVSDRSLRDKDIDVTKLLKSLKRDLSEVYSETKTIREFVVEIDRKFPRQCVVFYRWLSELLKRVSNIPIETMDWNVYLKDLSRREVVSARLSESRSRNERPRSIS
jgi:hypothetical protein